MKEHGMRIGALMRKDAKTLVRKIPSMLVLLTLLCLGCVCLCLTVIESVQKTTEKMILGVVDQDGTMASKLAIGMVTGNEEISALFQVRNFDTAQEAYDAVYRGQTVAAIVFEPGYLDKLGSGETSPINVVLSREMEIHSQVIRDFAGTGEILIKTGQYGADAAWTPVDAAYPNRTNALIKFRFFTAKFAVELLSLTGKSVDGVVLPYSDRAGSEEAHYILYYTVLLLTLLDMLFFDFVRRDNSRTLLCRMKSTGVGSGHILLAKVPFFVGIKGLLLAAVFTAVGFFIPVTVSVGTVLGALCAVLVCGAMGVGLCLLLQRSNVGPCILCALAFAGLFLSGGLIPYDMLPESVTYWGQFTHVGAVAALLSPMVGGTVTWMHYITALVMLALTVAAGKYCTDRLRTRGSEQI